MVRIFYYLVLKPLSYLPLKVLYGLSGIGYWVVYRIIGYRKSVVRENINNSFGDRTLKERKKIMNDFYRYLNDLMVETIWTFSLNERRIRKHFKVENPELLDQFYNERQSVVLVLAHYSSWEIVLSALNLFVTHQVETIYIPLSNDSFDKYYLRMRENFGAKMIPKKDFSESFEDNDTHRVIIFGADQSPSISKNIYWTNFLNQDTAVALGVERYAVKYDMPVVYARLTTVRRGYFNLRFETISSRPKDTKPTEITEKHVRLLEEQIISSPGYWLWSHKRWKRKRENK